MSAIQAEHVSILLRERAGKSVSGAGDVNGDGFSDLLIGSSQNNDGGSAAGSAYLILSDAMTAGAEPYRHSTRLAGTGDTVPLQFRQAGVWVDFTSNALSGGDVAVTRHIVHPCDSAKRLSMPIWDVEGNKMSNTTTVNLHFKFTDGHIAGLTESSLELYHRPAGAPCADWTVVPGSVVDVAHNIVTASGFNQMGQFTIADSLPSPTALAMVGFNPSMGRSLPAPMLMFVPAVLGAGTLLAFWRLRRRREQVWANTAGNGGLEAAIIKWLGDKLVSYLQRVPEKDLTSGSKSMGADRRETD